MNIAQFLGINVAVGIVNKENGPLNSWILLSSCGAKCTHRDFRFLLVRNLIEEAGRSQIAPPPVWLEGQVRLQQML